MNKSLHAIPVQRVFILKYYKGNFYYIDFTDFSDPITIDSWGLKRIETKPFTCIDSRTGIGCRSVNFAVYLIFFLQCFKTSVAVINKAVI